MSVRTQSSPHPWDVYAQQMFSHGYGYPLWLPEPSPSALPVQICDVAWMDGGGLRQLFNARCTELTRQVLEAVPDHFIPFNPPNLFESGPEQRLRQRVLCSRTLYNTRISGAVSADLGGLSVDFQCVSNAGAVLISGPLAHSREIQSHNHFREYMRENFDSWMAFARQWGLDLRDEDLCFVYGTTKTAEWSVSAFHGQYKTRSGSIQANFASVGSVGLSVDVANSTAPNCWHGVGPVNQERNSAGARFAFLSGADSPDSPESPPSLASNSREIEGDQCIFFRYYKMKRRVTVFPPRPMKAAAGYDQLPPPDHDQYDTPKILVEDLTYDIEPESLSDTATEYVPFTLVRKRPHRAS
ncbi:uncharacterized protein BXZ73DRAFT_54081 [Epithele typhae]|uniref:uncharacterized protein n=1 Tax=Epithele typhae TaxID=378194 RepID=UPI0020087914|nr:uncharacterized protein BXZ73DRAFT_54081 [Epithele typhae]KAH9915957.1 hypothetical protein BXZ73DRAFT_54081 [Epithele typhae]